jgi:hypothetical protein
MFKRNTAGSRMPNVQNAGNVRQSNNSISLATSRLLHDRSPQYHQHWPGRSQHHHRQAARAYSPSNYHIPQHYLSSTRKRKPDAPLQPWSNQPEARKLLALNNASRRPSTGIACGIRMVCTPPSHATTSKGPWEFHRSRTSGRKTTKKGGKTTQMTIYLN